MGATINDPEAVSMLNEQMRGLSNRMEDISDEITLLERDWNRITAKTGVGEWAHTLSDNDSLVEDGRKAEGLSRVTRGDSTNTMSLLQRVRDIVEGKRVDSAATPGTRDVIRKTGTPKSQR